MAYAGRPMVDPANGVCWQADVETILYSDCDMCTVLNVTGLRNRCGGILIDPQGTLIPQFGSSTIPVSCYWKIVAIDSHIVVLNVLSMDIRDSESCLDQFIKVCIVTLQEFFFVLSGGEIRPHSYWSLGDFVHNFEKKSKS